MVKAGDSTPPSTSKTLPVTQDAASDGEVEHAGGDVLGLADAVHRGVVLERVPDRVVGEHVGERRGLDPADLDRVDPHLGRELRRHRPRHHRQRRLRGRVRDEARLHHARGARRDVHDAPAAHRHHVRDAELGQRERGEDVELERGLDRSGARLRQRPRDPSRPRCSRARRRVRARSTVGLDQRARAVRAR